MCSKEEVPCTAVLCEEGFLRQAGFEEWGSVFIREECGCVSEDKVLGECGTSKVVIRIHVEVIALMVQWEPALTVSEAQGYRG